MILMNPSSEMELARCLFNNIISGSVSPRGSSGRFKAKERGGAEDTINVHFYKIYTLKKNI